MPVGLGSTIAVYPPPAHLPTPVADDDFRGDADSVRGSSNLTLQQVREEEERHLQEIREKPSKKKSEVEPVTTLERQLAAAAALVKAAHDAEKKEKEEEVKEVKSKAGSKS
ncbi:MAG: hypothetical protein ACREOB_07580 [Thermodesulfobacteriota bacterium]